MQEKKKNPSSIYLPCWKCRCDLKEFKICEHYTLYRIRREQIQDSQKLYSFDEYLTFLSDENMSMCTECETVYYKYEGCNSVRCEICGYYNWFKYGRELMKSKITNQSTLV